VAHAAGVPADGPRSFADLHAHSRGSFDSLTDPRAMVERALRLGLTHLAITDHERIEEAQRAVEVAIGLGTAGADISVIVGEEVRTRDGDLIGLYLQRAVPPGLSAAETSAAIREQGGLVGLPHPFDSFRSSGGSKAGDVEASLEALAGLVDYVEGHNARAYGDANAKAAAWAAGHGLPAVASSDAHSLLELGIASTILPGHFTNADELRALLPSATIVPGRASYYVRLWTPVAKVVQRVRGRGRVPPMARPPVDVAP
jgi:predicted metal-dependent phosphoesterase TrpH